MYLSELVSSWIDIAISRVCRMENRRFRREELIGQGSFCVCFKTVDIRTEKEYALRYTADSRKAKWLKERSIHGQLRHPHIAQYMCSFRGRNGDLCSVIELGELGSLDQMRIYGDDIKTCLSQMVSALQHLKRCSVIHRDIKPGNIVVSESSHGFTFKLIDFSLSTRSPYTRTSSEKPVVCGTLSYISPEQAYGLERYTYTIDTWGLGVTTYYLITGIELFDRGQTDYRLLLDIREGYPPPGTLSALSKPEQDLIIKTVAPDHKRLDIDQLSSLPFFN